MTNFWTAVQGSVSAQQLDLTDLASVRAAVAALQRQPRIDMLILNAGVMVRQQRLLWPARVSFRASGSLTPSCSLQGTKKSYTKDGFELQMGGWKPARHVLLVMLG